MAIPKYVALCGAPGSGKSEVSSILTEVYGARQIDDGMCLRKGAMALYGLSWGDVSTQEGKARSVVLCGQTVTVRYLLGALGKQQEAAFGDNFMPERAVASIDSSDSSPFFVFPSCRMKQGQPYLDNGGIVVEIVRPGYAPVNDFDYYDKSLVTFTIHNDDTTPLWREKLTFQVARAFDTFSLTSK